MENRVYGVIGISAIMSNWNADFTGYPKTTSIGDIFGSDKALKYPMKKMWVEQGEKVLYTKSYEFVKDELVPRTLKSRYEEIFQVEDLKTNKDTKVVLTNLFKALDVKNFGATFAEEGSNTSITGAVQIGQGFNKFSGTIVDEQTILSPFRDKKGKDGETARNSTLGTKVQMNEAHYLYPFAINTAVYNDFKSLGVTEGYTDEDYKKFKKVATDSVTAFATNSKIGCDNEFTMFIETDSSTYLPNLAEMIIFEKEEDTNIYEITCSNMINELGEKIKNVEIYYNTLSTKIVHNIKNAKEIDVITKKEV